MSEARPTFHALAWLAWATAAVACVELAPNPVYVGFVLVSAYAIVQVHGGHGPYRQAFRALVTIGVVFAALRVGLAALTTHEIGAAWFTLPAFAVPSFLGGFTIGGTIEQPVVIQALVDGLSIITIMAVFGAFNACASHHELLERTPRAFHELGLVLTIGLSFIPATLRAAHDARLADRARCGTSARRRGRTRRLVVPVLATGLERALALAESMDARGYAAQPAARSERVSGVLAIIGCCGLGGALIALVGDAVIVATASVTIGALAITGAVMLASRATGRVRHRPRRLTRADAFVIATACAAPLLMVAAAGSGDTTRAWAVTPLVWPRLGALPLIALAFLLAPLIPIRWQLHPSARSRLQLEPTR